MTAPPYPAKGTTDWYEPLHDYTEGIRDEADDKIALKADTASLGTAAFANTGDFATATQGGKADSAVQPAALSAGLATKLDTTNVDHVANTAARHTHTNKLTLDGISTQNLAPNGGLVGQVLTVGTAGRVWADVPGALTPLAMLNPATSWDRNGIITPTLVGAMRNVSAGDGTGWLVEEGTVNLHLNPLAVGPISGHGATGWYMWASATTIYTRSIDTALNHEGIGSWFRVDVSDKGEAGNTFTLRSQVTDLSLIGPTGGSPVSMSMWVASSRSQTLNMSLRALIEDVHTEVASGSFTIGPTPSRISLSYTVPSGTSITAFYFAFPPTATFLSNGDVYWLSGAQLEMNPYATSFATGSMGTGFSWSGAANASTSIRADASFSTPVPAWGAVYIRHDGTSTVLTAPGAFGTYGDLAYSGGVATVSSSRANTIAAVVFLPRVPTMAEWAWLNSLSVAQLQALTSVPPVFWPTFMATNKTASGTTNLRTAPGAATTLVVALVASTLIQDTGGRVTESSIPYAQVIAVVGGGNVTGWIPVSQITSL